MSEQDDEAAEVGVEDLRDFLAELAEELFGVFDGLGLRVKTFVDEIDNDQRQCLRAQFLQLRSLSFGKELHQVINYIALIDEVSKRGLKGGMQGLTVIGLQDGLKDDEDAHIDFLLLDEVALDDFDADIDVLLEELCVDLLLLPQNGEV